MWETWIWALGWEDALEKGKATHSSILVWRIPWTPWGHKELDTTERLSLSLSHIESFLFNPPLIWNFLSSLDKTYSFFRPPNF